MIRIFALDGNWFDLIRSSPELASGQTGALAFGVGVLFMFGYRLLERIGLPTLDVSDPVLPMMISNMVSHFIAARRYR